MAYLRLKRVWTPLRMVGIRFYRDLDTGKWYIRKGSYGKLERLSRSSR